MSFSATILFSPPNAAEAKCCCCTCKQEPGAQAAAPPPPPCAPITVTGSGLAVQSSDQLLHVIYQRVEKAVGLAEVALSLAKANNEALRRLEEEVGALRQASGPPLKASPPCASEERQEDSEEEEEEEEREVEGFRNGVQVVIEELRQLGAAAGPLGPLGFSPVQLGAGGLGRVCRLRIVGFFALPTPRTHTTSMFFLVRHRWLHEYLMASLAAPAKDLLRRDAFWESCQALLCHCGLGLKGTGKS